MSATRHDPVSIDASTHMTPLPTGTACYVYGIMPAEAQLPEGLQGVGDPAGEVGRVDHEELAAVISPVDPDQPIGTSPDLRAHERVLDIVADATVVLPMRFGAVLADERAVSEELLAAHHEDFAETLAGLAGHAQFTVKGRYVDDAVVREVLREDPEAMRLRERLRGLPDDAGYYDRIRLGELVTHALGAWREADEATLVDALVPHVASISAHSPVADDGAVDVAFLVHQEQREAFEQTLEALGERWHGRIRLSLLGPLAPYDFVNLTDD